MKTYPLVATLAAFALFAHPALAGPAKSEPVPVIAELFTSEGCSSCPPADAILKRLAETQPIPGAQVIALGYHVDYWNNLGWKDLFSSPLYTARQEKYREGFGNSQVYTPQLVVNGIDDVLGSDEEHVTKSIRHAAWQMQYSPVRIVIVPRGNDSYTITVSGKPKYGEANLWVATTESGIASQVKRGENAGRRLEHVAVVRRLIRLGSKTKATVRLPLAAGEKRTNAHVVAWLQQGEMGTIIGAGQVSR